MKIFPILGIILLLCFILSFQVSGAPTINITYPLNDTTVSTSHITWTTNELLDWAGYSLDGGGNETLSPSSWYVHDAVAAYYCTSGIDVATPCSLAVDKSFETQVYSIYPQYATIYENITIPSGISSANWTYKKWDYYGGALPVYYWNYSLGNWQMLNNNSNAGYITTTIVIPSDGLTSPLRIKSQVQNNRGYGGETGGFSTYYEGKATWVGVGNATFTTISDGFHNVTIHGNNSAGQMGQSSYIYFTRDTTPPNTTINKPASNGNYTQLNTTLNITASDVTSSIDTCLYSTDSWATNTTFNHSQETSFISNHGSNTLLIACNDTAGNINNTESATFYVFTPPAFVSPTPAIGWNSSGNNSFEVKILTNASMDVCYLEWDISGTPANTTLNQYNGTQYNISKTETVQGNYSYRILCNSTLNGHWINSSIRDLYIFNPPVDSDPPDRYNWQPIGPTYASTQTTVLISGNTNEPATCRCSHIDSIYPDMSLTMSSTGGTIHTHTFTVSVGHDYIYYIRCNDTSGNINNDSISVYWSVESAGGNDGGPVDDDPIIITPGNVSFSIYPTVRMSPNPYTQWIKPNNTVRFPWLHIENTCEKELNTTVFFVCSENDSYCMKDWLWIEETPETTTLASKQLEAYIISANIPDAEPGYTYTATVKVTACEVDDATHCLTKSVPAVIVIPATADIGAFLRIQPADELWAFLFFPLICFDGYCTTEICHEIDGESVWGMECLRTWHFVVLILGVLMGVGAK